MRSTAGVTPATATSPSAGPIQVWPPTDTRMLEIR